MRPVKTTRRGLLKGLGALGCSAAAFPALTPITLAAAPFEARLVVIVLRGGMDGLDVVQPVGDPDFRSLRPDFSTASIDLDGFFALNDGLAPLKPLWVAGELAFAHAVATPYRDKRSHFDGQDILEAGTVPGGPGGVSFRDGWLNRLVQAVPGATVETALAAGRDNMKILTGEAEVSRWAPGTRLDLSPQAELLLEQIYRGHPLFEASAREAAAMIAALSDEAQGLDAQDAAATGMEAVSGRVRGDVTLARFVADRLNAETRIAAFSLSGWDTHRNQASAIAAPLERLAAALLALKAGLGPNWGRTCVLAMTEFGRTARENGTRGTDHGTGGAMLMAGGAIRGGKVYADWPGLAEADLYDRRDLMPTRDVRAFAGWALRGLFGLDTNLIEDDIFPLLDIGTDPGLIL